MIKDRNKLIKCGERDGKIAFRPQKIATGGEKQFCLIADKETGMAQSTMKGDKRSLDRTLRGYK